MRCTSGVRKIQKPPAPQHSSQTCSSSCICDAQLHHDTRSRPQIRESDAQTPPTKNHFHVIASSPPRSQSTIIHQQTNSAKLTRNGPKPPGNLSEPPGTQSYHSKKSIYLLQTCLKAQNTNNNNKTKNQRSTIS